MTNLTAKMSSQTGLKTLEALDAIKANTTLPLLVQLGSKPCTNCPPFTTRVLDLGNSHQFTRVYVDVHDAEEELLDVFNVKRLPAYALFKENALVEQKENATLEDLTAVISNHCIPVLTTDDDF